MQVRVLPGALTPNGRPYLRELIHAETARPTMDEVLAGMRYPMQAFQRRVLALRHNLTAYDAFYVVLAEALDLPLLTDDRTFASASGHRAHIETWPAAS